MGMSEVRRSAASGFTLIELMIVIVIVAVLIGVALPAYQDQVMRGHRATAKGEMLKIGVLQKQYLLAHKSYATSDILLNDIGYDFEASDASSRYKLEEITLGTASYPTYVIQLTPEGPQAADGWLRIDSAGARSSEFPGKWSR